MHAMSTAKLPLVLVLFWPVIAEMTFSNGPTTTQSMIEIECCDSSLCEGQLENSFCGQTHHRTDAVCMGGILVQPDFEIRKKRGFSPLESSPVTTTESEYPSVGICRCLYGYTLSEDGDRCVPDVVLECCTSYDCFEQYGGSGMCVGSTVTTAMCVGSQAMIPRRRKRQGELGNGESTTVSDSGDDISLTEGPNFPAGICVCVPNFDIPDGRCPNATSPTDARKPTPHRACHSFTCEEEDQCTSEMDIEEHVCENKMSHHCYVSKVCTAIGHTLTFGCTDVCRPDNGTTMPNCHTVTCSGELCNNNTAVTEQFPCQSGAGLLEIKYHVVVLYGIVSMFYYQ